MFETLYMFDFMDGSLRPLLADGDYAWNETMTELTVKIKDAAERRRIRKIQAQIALPRNEPLSDEEIASVF